MPQPSAFFLRSSLRTSCALQDAQQPTSQSDAAEEAPLPHSSYNFWSGFYDPVDPPSPACGQKAKAAGPIASPTPRSKPSFSTTTPTRKSCTMPIRLPAPSCSATRAMSPSGCGVERRWGVAGCQLAVMAVASSAASSPRG